MDQPESEVVEPAVPVVYSEGALAIVQEFQNLVEQSSSMFIGLRELSPTGRTWQPYFQKTFQIYTKLWKFQQTNRAVLENVDFYGLKRTEIGEIASKIGQLYYHYYLRTSVTSYLTESQTFYQAIIERQYFSDITLESQHLYVKKLRFYARFIVVLLLLASPAVNPLIDELRSLVEAYSTTAQPDVEEWKTVLKEISEFTYAQSKSLISDDAGKPYVFERRLFGEQLGGCVQEAVLIGCKKGQRKFSELTLDVYRMLHFLESPHEKKEMTEGDAEIKKKRVHLHKYLLYQPSVPHALSYVSTAFKDVQEENAMLVYVSGEALQENEIEGENGVQLVGESATECLYPLDLASFARKNLLVIVDCKVSAFNFKSHFNRNAVCLVGSGLFNDSSNGSPFTNFLTSPLHEILLQKQQHTLATEEFLGIQQKFSECEEQVEQLVKRVLDGKNFGGEVGAVLIVRFVMWLAWCDCEQGRGSGLCVGIDLESIRNEAKTIMEGLN